MNETIAGTPHVNICSNKIIPIYAAATEIKRVTVNLALGSGSDAHACNFQTGFLNGSRETKTAMHVDTHDTAEFS